MEIRRSLSALFLSSAMLLVNQPIQAAPLTPNDLLGPGVNHPERTWKTFETTHLIVHYYQGYEAFSRLAASIAERSFNNIATDLGVSPSEKIPLIITEDEFWNGYAEPLRTRIVLDPRFALEPTIGLARFLLHEMTHIFNFLAVDDGSPYGRLKHAAGLPAWFAEGLAQYEAEYWTPEMDRLLRLNSLDKSILTPSERNAFIPLGSRGADGYNEGYALVKYLFDTYGHEKLEVLLRIYRQQNMDFDQALELCFGKSMLVLEAEWRDGLEARYKDQLRHRFEKIEIAEELIPYKPSRTWYSPKVSPNGKWLAYMGTGNYPTIRGFLYSILPLHTANLGQLQKFGEQEKAQAELEASKAEHVAPKKSEKEPEKELKLKDIQHKLVPRVLDFNWAPDSQSIAYSTLTANENGNTTTRVFLQKVEEKDGKLQAKDAPQEITPGKTSHSVAFLPTGREALLVVEENGLDHLDLYDLDNHKQIRRLLSAPDFRQYRAISVSPKGQAAVLEVFLPGQGQHLLEIQLDSGTIEQLTNPAPRESDRHPIWSPDGKSIYFISTRTGFADLYQLNLEDHLLKRLSQVYSGLETPSFTPDGQHLLHMRHHARGTTIDQVALNDLKVFDVYQEGSGEAIFEQETSLSPLPKLDFNPKDYIPWIAPEVVVPVVGRDEAGDQLGFLALYSDLLQQHAFNVLLLYGLASSRISYSAAYVNRFFDTSFGVSIGDSPLLSFTTDGSQFFLQRDQQISLFASRPLFNLGSGDTSATRVERFLNMEFTVSKQSNLTSQLNGQIESRQLREGFNNTLSLNFSDDRTQVPDQNFRYSLSVLGGSGLWGSEYDFMAASGEWRHYIPTWGKQQLAYMLTGTAMKGETRPALLGGPPLSSLLVLNFQNIIPLRGFSIAQLQGPMMIASNIEYRFPILDPVIFTLGTHYLKDLQGAFFVDIGDAWYPDQRAPFPHIGTGFELRSNVILNRRNSFTLYIGAGKALLGSGANFLTEKPVEFYGGFANAF